MSEYSLSLFDKLDNEEKKIFDINFLNKIKKIENNNNLDTNKKIKIIIGAPAVGKTTYINNLKKQFNNYFVLETDDFRKHLKKRFKQNVDDYGCITNNYSFLFSDMLLDFLIKNDYNLICSFSFTNSYIWFFDFIETLTDLNYTIEIILLEKEVEVLLENNEKRYEKEFIENGFGRKVEKEKILKSFDNIKLLKKDLSMNDIDFLTI